MGLSANPIYLGFGFHIRTLIPLPYRIMAQADSLRVAHYLHATADQKELFINLPAVSEASTLQRILDGIEGLTY